MKRAIESNAARAHNRSRDMMHLMRVELLQHSLLQL
jgi:hypothetical protein